MTGCLCFRFVIVIIFLYPFDLQYIEQSQKQDPDNKQYGKQYADHFYIEENDKDSNA